MNEPTLCYLRQSSPGVIDIVVKRDGLYVEQRVTLNQLLGLIADGAKMLNGSITFLSDKSVILKTADGSS